MSRPNDSLLDPRQLANVRSHADRLLNEASALGRYPTPIDDLMAAAKLTVVPDEILNESFLRQFMKRAKAGVASIKSALSKVLGLYDAEERLVIIDAGTPPPRVPFIKLHEAGHGSLPHQSKAFKLVQDCEQTLNPDITDLFEREANVFASDVLFQGDGFFECAQEQDFGIKVPMRLAKKFGASNYATFRRYVGTSPRGCCLIVLNPATIDANGTLSCEIRRVVMSKSFAQAYDEEIFGSAVGDSHSLGPIVPTIGRRMTQATEVCLRDRNGQQRVCVAEAFDTTHNTLILLLDTDQTVSSSIVIPFTFRISAL